MKSVFLGFLLAVFSITPTLSKQDRATRLIAEQVRTVSNYPKDGIEYKDITGLFSHPKAFRAAILKFKRHYKGQKIDAIVAMESLGLLFGVALAQELKVPLIIASKKQLPGDTVSSDFERIFAAKTSGSTDKKGDLFTSGGTAAALGLSTLGQKLPGKKIGAGYRKVSGWGHITIQKEKLTKGQNILFVNDFLATGVGAKATIDLLKNQGVNVMGAAFVAEIKALQGRTSLEGIPTYSILTY